MNKIFKKATPLKIEKQRFYILWRSILV